MTKREIVWLRQISRSDDRASRSRLQRQAKSVDNFLLDKYKII